MTALVPQIEINKSDQNTNTKNTNQTQIKSSDTNTQITAGQAACSYLQNNGLGKSMKTEPESEPRSAESLSITTAEAKSENTTMLK